METDQAPSFLSLLNEPGRSFPSADTLKRKPVDYLPSAGKRSRDTGGSEHGFLPSNATAVPSQSSPLAGPSIDSLSTGDDPSKRHSFLLGDVLNDLDQTERDELSQVNWNQGRRRGPAGVFTCVLDRRRQLQREHDVSIPGTVRKKKVRFVSDEKLVKVQHFVLDENERENVFKTGGQPGMDLKKSDSQSERLTLEHAQEETEISNRKVVVEETAWHAPLPISGLPQPLVTRGKDSVEKIVFIARQSGSLTALLHNREDLPDNPEEPAESLVLKGASPDQFKLIPLVRPGMNVCQPLSLVPSGPILEGPVKTSPVPPIPVPHQFGMTNGNVPPGQTEREPHAVSLPLVKTVTPPVSPSYLPGLTVDSIARMLKTQSDAQKLTGPQTHTSTTGPGYHPQGPPPKQAAATVAPYHPQGPPPYVHSYNSHAPGNRQDAPPNRYPAPPMNQQFHNGAQGQQQFEKSNSWGPRPATNQSQNRGQFAGNNSHNNNGRDQQQQKNGPIGSYRPRKPTVACKYHTMRSGCRNGDSCTFLHG